MHVRIVGGGIGGSATALALDRRGVSVTVHESTTVLEPAGAGILLWPNAMAALSRIGLADPIREAGAVVERLRVLDPAGRHVRTADLTADVEGRCRPSVYLHRARLQRCMVERLPDGVFHLGETCVGVTRAETEPRVQFADGRSVSGTVVVGADGIGSRVRATVVDTANERKTGTIAYRGVAPVESPLTAGETLQVWGSGTRVGLAALGDGRTHWFATTDEPPADAANSDALLSALCERYCDYPAPFPDILARTEPEAVVVTPLSDLKPLPRWHRGRVTLLGDAAHAMLPYLGQGAAQAIEDAVALGARLGTMTPSKALLAYERARKTRAERILRLSRFWWRLAQLKGTAATLRNGLIRNGPSTVARWQQQWLARLHL